jgi:hypothetical protein
MITDKTLNKINVDIAVILNKVGYIEKEVVDIKSKLDKEYVTQDQFQPIQRVVYGMIGTILLGVLGAFLALVINK